MLLVWRRGRWLAGFFGLMGVLGTYRITTLSQKQVQRSITVYHVPRQKRLIDFFDGSNLYALSDTLTDRQEIFAAKANRVASAIRHKDAILLDEKTPVYGPNLLLHKPLLQFHEKKIALIDDAQWLLAEPKPSVEVDVLLISKNAAVSIKECRAQFPFTIAVFDASNSRRNTTRWIKECQENGWPFHDVRTQGAWIGRF
jgi:competence protein ComEC